MGIPYLNVNSKSIVYVNIACCFGEVAPVTAIVPKSYSFTAQNQFDTLLNSSHLIASLTKGINVISQLTNLDPNISLVPYSPQIWMGATPLTMSELELHFVAYNSAADEVHAPLMRLLAMALPARGWSIDSIAGIKMDVGMLKHPPAVSIRIGSRTGSVIRWQPCYLASVTVSEEAPYDSNGYGYHGTATVTIIRRNYAFAEDFANNRGDYVEQTVRPAGTGNKK